MKTFYRVAAWDRGQKRWDFTGVGNDSEANKFDSVAEADAMIAELKTWGDEWADGKYAVEEWSIEDAISYGWVERPGYLEYLAEQAVGLRYDSKEAEAIMDINNADWSNFWPTVGRDGLLDGGIVESGETEDYINVDDMAMILRELLRRDEYSDDCLIVKLGK